MKRQPCSQPPTKAVPPSKAPAAQVNPALVGTAPLLLAMLLGACADPGTGGTGIPGPTAGAPVSPEPVEAPPSVEAPAVLPPGCAASHGASADPFTGQVRASTDDCLLVDERAIVISTATIQRRSGVAASAAELVAGIYVTVEPEPSDPGRARMVIIEDTAN